VAFFPGTFDPFSLSHKGIVQAIRNLGFEVYLAIDEFSWSKKAQPSLVRRQLVSMSVADEFDVYLFPHDLPVNLANPRDLDRLREVFDGRELYLAVGSDVVANASSYKTPVTPSSVQNMNHLVFRRQSDADGNEIDANLSVHPGQGGGAATAHPSGGHQLHPHPGEHRPGAGHLHPHRPHGAGLHLPQQPLPSGAAVQAAPAGRRSWSSP
jgi:nicotinic acid mononucleotide adenylyltransferase